LSSKRDTYNAGAELTYKLVCAWKEEKPAFSFPPRDVALIADLRDCGELLARNDTARRLVALLIEHCVKETGQAPTAMMLRVSLEMAGVSFDTWSGDDLRRARGDA
jgi:hypothetical protein